MDFEFKTQAYWAILCCDDTSGNWIHSQIQQGTYAIFHNALVIYGRIYVLNGILWDTQHVCIVGYMRLVHCVQGLISFGLNSPVPTHGHKLTSLCVISSIFVKAYSLYRVLFAPNIIMVLSLLSTYIYIYIHIYIHIYPAIYTHIYIPIQRYTMKRVLMETVIIFVINRYYYKFTCSHCGQELIFVSISGRMIFIQAWLSALLLSQNTYQTWLASVIARFLMKSYCLYQDTSLYKYCTEKTLSKRVHEKQWEYLQAA